MIPASEEVWEVDNTAEAPIVLRGFLYEKVTRYIRQGHTTPTMALGE